MGLRVESFIRAWRSVGAFSNGDKPLGIAKRAALSATEVAVSEKRRSGLSPDNIIHEVIAIESRVSTPQQILLTYARLTGVLTKLKMSLTEGLTPQQKLGLAYTTLREEGMRFAEQKDQTFTGCLAEGNLDCDASSLLVLAVAHEMRWPVIMQAVPEHNFVRWEAGTESFNMDMGINRTDDFYLKETGIEAIRPLKARAQILAHAHGTCAYKCQQAGQHEEAIRVLDAAIKLDANASFLYHLRGRSKHNLRRLEEAISDFNEAIRLNPKDKAALLSRSTAKYALGQKAEAARDLTAAKAIRTWSENVAAEREAQARLARELADNTRTIEQCSQAISKYPDLSELYYFRGLAYKALGRNKEAVPDFRMVIELRGVSDFMLETATDGLRVP
jgi:tetratricopeptide (TPR) repeat protein